MEPDQWHHELRITWSLGCLGYGWFPDDTWDDHPDYPGYRWLQDLYIYLCLSLKHCVVSHPPLSWLTYSCFKFHQLLGSLDTSCFTTPKPRNWREFLEKGLRSRLRRTADQWHGESLRIFAMLDCVKSLDFCHELLYFQVFFSWQSILGVLEFGVLTCETSFQNYACETANHQVLRGGHAGYLLIYTVGKLLAFNLSVSARFPGDTLEPVLIAGAFLGGAIGNLGIRFGVRTPWGISQLSQNGEVQKLANLSSAWFQNPACIH